jgi:hypothetical protein
MRADKVRILDSALSRADAIPLHCRPDSERLLRAHNAWQASWDKSDEEEAPDLDALIQQAFNLYSDGLSPIQVRWRMVDCHPLLPARVLTRAQRRAEAALVAAESAPPELRRAMVAAARQKAIQGALATREWGPALKGLERAGEIAGELRESAGLAEEDLVLTVTVEDAGSLPGGDSQPVPAENDSILTVETLETEAES